MHSRSRRRGMTLVEIMISLVLLGIVSGVIMRVVTRQQRFYQGVNQIMTQRGQLRQATSVLPIDLRSLSSIGQDILAASDSAIEYNVNIGTGVVCAVVATGTQVVLPPLSLANSNTTGNTFTSFFEGQEPTDSMIARGVDVYIYNDSNVVGNADDTWKRFNLVAMHGSFSDCLTKFGAGVVDAGKRRPVLQLSDPLGFTDVVTGGPISRYISSGAPVRLVRRVRYKLYQESDGKWYLGFSEWHKGNNAYMALSPVSGPYVAYSSGSGSGVLFRYYDVDGTEISSGAGAVDRARIARIDLIARARTSSAVRAAGIQNGVSQQYKDSLAVTVMLRNRQ